MESVQNMGKALWGRIDAWRQANPQRAAITAVVVVGLILGFVLRAPQPHVALSGEPLLTGDGFFATWLTNSILTTLVVDIVLILLAWSATRSMNLVPSGLQNVMEAVIEYLYNLAESVAGKAAQTYFPYVATIFLFIILSNWSGLIPLVGSLTVEHGAAEAEGGHARSFDSQLAMADGKLVLVTVAAEEEAHAKKVPLFRAPTADLNTTFALAVMTMFLVQYYGVKALGGSYFRKFWNITGEGYMKGIFGFVSILELVSEISRILTFGFRLFGNIFAGEVVLATMAFLCAYLVPVPFYMLELLVGAVQALVFMMLALAFFSMATISHGGHDEAHEAHH